MADPSPSPYTEQELELLASLRNLRPDDSRLEAPPAHVWAGIDRALAETGPDPGRAVPARRRWWLAAAALLIAAGAGAVALLGEDGTDEVVVAATELTSDGLAGAPAGLRGDAKVIETDAGEVIRVEIGDLHPASGEYLEVWLIKPDVSGMVSLGTVRPDSTYELPTGLSLRDYPIVDVSTEPYDGNPVHSGASLLRGVLGT